MLVSHGSVHARSEMQALDAERVGSEWFRVSRRGETRDFTEYTPFLWCHHRLDTVRGAGLTTREITDSQVIGRGKEPLGIDLTLQDGERSVLAYPLKKRIGHLKICHV